MKRIFKSFAILAAAALAAAGCSKEIVDTTMDKGDEITTEFTVATSAISTKAVADNDGFAANVDECLIQIWMDVDGTYKLYSTPTATQDGSNRLWKFTATFIKNQKYQILVWADTKGRYTFGTDGIVTRNDITIDNEDDLDAFFANEPIDASKAITNKTIIARRPFAQLNVITTDLMKINPEFHPETISISYEAPASLNLLTGELGADETFTVTDSPVYYAAAADESTLSMDYIFAPADDADGDGAPDKIIKDFDYTIAYTVPINREFNNIPLQRNYRTNIIGNLLSVDEDFLVVVNPIWDQPEIDMDVVAIIDDVCYYTVPEAVAAAPADGSLTRIAIRRDTEDAGFVVAKGQNIEFDLNGFTYSINENVGSSSTLTSGIQALKGAAVTLKNGTLTSTTAKNLIQNYADLTVEDVILDGTQSAVLQYVISNNCGNVNLIGSTTIYTDGATKAANGAKAFDACWAPNQGYPEGTQITVNTTGNIEGDIEFDLWGADKTPNLSTIDIINGTFYGNFVISGIDDQTAAENINIYGGKFAVKPALAYLADGYAFEENGGMYEIKAADFMVNGIAYDTLDEAVAALNAGDELQIAKAGSYTLPKFPENVTVKTAAGRFIEFILNENYTTPAGITFKNAIFYAPSSVAGTDGAIKVKDDAAFDGCTFYLESKYAVTVFGGTANFTDCNWACNGKSRGIMVWGGTPVINVEGCTFDCVYPYNVDGGTPTTTFKNSTLNGWTSYGKGTVSFDGCKFGKSTSGYAFCRPYVNTTFTDCEFSEDYRVDFGAAGLTFTMNGCTQNGATVTTFIIEPGMQSPGTLVIDGVSYEMSKYELAGDVAALEAAVADFNASTETGEIAVYLAPGTYEAKDIIIYQNVKDKSLKIAAQTPGTVTMKLAAGSQSNAIFAIAGESNFSNPESVTFEGIKFDFSALTLSQVTSAVYFCAANESYLPTGTSHRYGHNLIMNNCEFIGEGTENSMLFTALQNTSPNHITIDGCTVKNAGYITSGYGSDLVVKNTTTIDCKAAINLQNVGITVENCTFNTYHDYCVRTNGGPVVIKNTTFNCDYSGTDATSGLVVLRGTETAEATISGCTSNKASSAMNDIYCKTAWTVNGSAKAAGTGINF